MNKASTRNKGIVQIMQDVNLEADSIMEKFQGFTDDVRMLLLLQRNKDGGHNKEEKRIFESYVTTNTDEFKSKLINLMYLMELYPNCRIYSCVNPRSKSKIIREIHNSLIEQYYSDEVCRESIQKKIIKNPRHFVMQPKCKTSSYFLIDVDDVEGVDAQGDALQQISELDVVELLRYRTKNGWHIITEPFNLTKWDSTYSEVKKDALLLLKY